jgi:hypothetical protein
MNKKKNIVLALLLTSAILLAGTNLSSVLAQTTSSTYVYDSIGGTIAANGNAVTGGTSVTSNTNENAEFTATAQSGFEFLAWEYATAAGGCTVTDNPASINITVDGAIQALFIPTTNTTATSTQTGAATVIIYNSIGGETNPVGAAPPATYTNYNIGDVVTFTTTPGADFKFLYWIVATSTSNYYTSSTLDLPITEDTVVMQAVFIPTDSDVTLPGQATPTPTVPEFSGIVTAAIIVALVAVAFGTYTYSKKAKN